VKNFLLNFQGEAEIYIYHCKLLTNLAISAVRGYEEMANAIVTVELAWRYRLTDLFVFYRWSLSGYRNVAIYRH
jgi:hypothetical protein